MSGRTLAAARGIPSHLVTRSHPQHSWCFLQGTFPEDETLESDPEKGGLMPSLTICSTANWQQSSKLVVLGADQVHACVSSGLHRVVFSFFFFKCWLFKKSRCHLNIQIAGFSFRGGGWGNQEIWQHQAPIPAWHQLPGAKWQYFL